ncbi:MAG: zf-HC2 domain-containing protein [Acidobacteria bacterium]|nr:zf-HC2 domain-containing protein [Acidobacteriota bacterium]
MDSCRKTQKKLISIVWNELDGRERADLLEHIKGCPECERIYNEMSKTLKKMETRKRPEPSSAFMEKSWSQLKQEMTEKKGRGRFNIPSLIGNLSLRPVLSPGFAGSILILFIGMFIGWILFSGKPDDNQLQIPTDQNTGIQNITYQERTDRLLERSKTMLLAFVNWDAKTDDTSILDLDRSKKLSANLLTEAVSIRKQLPASERARVNELITDLEYILLQLANIEGENDLENIEIIQTGIDSRGIILKINLEEISRLSQKQEKKKINENTI